MTLVLTWKSVILLTLYLPGRVPGYKNDQLILLPSHTKIVCMYIKNTKRLVLPQTSFPYHTENTVNYGAYFSHSFWRRNLELICVLRVKKMFPP